MAVDPAIMYLVAAAVVVVTLLIITKFFGGDSKKEAGEARVREVGQPVAARARENVPPGARARRRPVRRRGLQVADDDSDEEAPLGGAGGGGGDEDEMLDDINLPEGKIGAKKLRKLQDKAEKKRQREIELQEREEKKERDRKLEAQRKKEEDKRKAEESLEADEAKKRKEEEERREHEEYLKMKAMFSVEEEGESEQVGDLESGSLLQQFINYIKEMKVVMLEDLAAHFKIRTQDCINRINDLQAEGSLTGVIDDRGKFIYITVEELESVAKYIRQLGRVSIIDLAKSSNRLINLNPDNADVQKKLLVGDVDIDEMNFDDEESVTS